MMSDEKEGDLPPAQHKYQQWLRSKQVHVASNLVTTTNDTNLVVAGWGCVAKTDIEPGTVLFSIPRDACFGASVTENDDDDGEEEEDPTTRDTQMDLAMSILHCQNQQYLDNNYEAKAEEDWSPFPLSQFTHSTTSRSSLDVGTRIPSCHVTRNGIGTCCGEQD
eukprot:scaffold3597_cov82-Skeletonema_marinoi.AAC.2